MKICFTSPKVNWNSHNITVSLKLAPVEILFLLNSQEIDLANQNEINSLFIDAFYRLVGGL